MVLEWAADVRFRVWTKAKGDDRWRKSEPVVCRVPVVVSDSTAGTRSFGGNLIAESMQVSGLTDMT